MHLIYRTSILLLIVFISFQPRVSADEGMWLPLYLKQLNEAKMKQLGLELMADDIYNINQSSLKDAIVQFGGGCTGEMISAEGLLLTNHHCGLGQIQQHSSVENDILQNGFWAYDKNQELVNPGLSVKFLIRMENVSERINALLQPEMTEKERNEIILAESKKIEKEATSNNHYEARVYPFFAGNEFYLILYEVFKDVRLVGTPAWGIGKFGADTDNWMWPRHKGDFCLFRVYTAPDGSPAEYAPENVPLQPKHHFPISLKGYQENDFTMILGYPGRTNRYLSSAGVEKLLEYSAPTIIQVRTAKLDIYRASMDADPDVFIQYASKQARTSNYWKYSIGQVKQLKRNKVIDRKLELEKRFEAWLQANPGKQEIYGNALPLVLNGYRELFQYENASNYFMEAIARGSEILTFANLVTRQTQAKGTNNDQLRATITSHFKDFHAPTDQKVLAAMLLLYEENVPEAFHPDEFKKIARKAKGDYSKFAEKLFKNSAFASEEACLELLDKPEKYAKDEAYELFRAFVESYLEVKKLTDPVNESIQRGERLFLAGLREMEANRDFYPDANFTMRLTYGTIGGYQPADAVYYDSYTLIEGIMEKEIPNNWEFDVPDNLKQAFETKDYGRYTNDKGELVVNFITNTDITGGNSGSPVLNGKGELIGCAFDGNWEAMSGDIAFEPELQRTIVVDSRFILFVIDKLAGAQNLINELTIIE